ncbi:MAG: polynucleotide adenylyltransferase [Firmicutes bacterium]|nr:polynucleotide adenylyltransferase [Bacillota bacterium]
MEISIPLYTDEILNRLIENGYDSYIVGGSIRDSLMGKTPIDWDITTLAEPHQVIELFKEKTAILTGEKYGTVTIVCHEGKVEVTTFRSEGNYTDGRHPDWIRFEKNIENDLSRRDFTINAIAYNRIRGIVDPYKGRDDILSKTIRTVGNPIGRFNEDRLRMIRAIRFSTSLCFELEENSLYAIKSLAHSIEEVSSERIREELFKILADDNSAEGIKKLLHTDLLKYILPEVKIVQEYNKGNIESIKYILCLLNNTPAIISIRMAVLFKGKKPLEKIDCITNAAYATMKELCFSNDLIKETVLLIEHFEKFQLPKTKYHTKVLIKEIGKDTIYHLIALLKADAYCKEDNAMINNLLKLKNIIDDIFNNKEPIELADLDINGNDIVRMGFDEGEIIGRILKDLMLKVLKTPELNEKVKLKRVVTETYLNKKGGF